MIQSYVPQDKWSHNHWPAVNSSAPPSRGPCPQCIRINPEKDINSDINRPIPCPLNSLNCTLSSAGHMMHQRLPLLDPQYTTRSLRGLVVVLICCSACRRESFCSFSSTRGLLCWWWLCQPALLHCLPSTTATRDTLLPCYRPPDRPGEPSSGHHAVILIETT